MKKGYDKLVRFPPGSDKLIKKLNDMAASENRSLNGQIIHILKETVEAYKQAGLVK